MTNDEQFIVMPSKKKFDRNMSSIEYSKLKIDQFFEMRKNNNFTKF
jgi:hypothetical protein